MNSGPSPNSSQGPLLVPHQKQYPLRPEVKEGLIPIIKDLKRQGLLIDCSIPYNTPILNVRKGPKGTEQMEASPRSLPDQ
jgi:hypothetical protein